MHIRHGDVNFHLVKKIEGEIIKHNGSFIVELGEHTGHKHVLTVERPADLEIRKDAQGRYFFSLKSDGKLVHEDHKTITLPAGIYKKSIERELDHFSDAIQRVLD